MGGYGVTDPTYQALSADDDPNKVLASIVSPVSAQKLVGEPPDSPPPSAPGQSTPRTGTLAAAPSQAVAKNRDLGTGYNSPMTGVSSPPNGGNVISISPAIPLKPAGLQPAVGGLAAQQAQRVQAYNNSPASAAYARSQSPVSTDPANPDPGASLRPAGTSPAVPLMPAGTQQPNPPTPLDAAQAKLNNLVAAGSGIDQIKNPVGRGFARAGDIALRLLAPAAESLLPGTQGNYERRLGQQQQIVGNDQAQLQSAAALEDTQQKTKLEEAKAAGTALVPVTPEMAAVNPALAGLVGQSVTQQTLGGAAKAATAGMLRNEGQIDKQDDQDSYQAQNAKTLADVRQTQEDLNRAKTDAANADPSTAAGRAAIAKLQSANAGHDAAMMRAQAMLMNSVAGNKGTDLQGNPLPGAMLTDQGVPVGAHFQGNVRPTGQERGKADMAASAEEQLSDIKSIIQKHPTLFGPGYGQASAFRQWVGSQDPDAQRFLAARTIAGDHLAGTFGGRSETALHALDNAIGQFKDNPKAAIAGIDQLTKANQRFKQAGTVKTVGSNAAKPAPLKPATAPLKPATGGGFNWDAHPLVNP